MESIDVGATIRMGYKVYPKTERWLNELKILTYSLKIDKKFITAHEGGRAREYLEVYREAAEKIAPILNERNVERYVIYNGYRIRNSTMKWISCENIENDGEVIFKETLDKLLNHKCQQINYHLAHLEISKFSRK